MRAEPILLARGRRADVLRVTDEHGRARVAKRVGGGQARARVAKEMEREFELLRGLRARGLVDCLGLESDGETWSLLFEDLGGTSLDLHPDRVSVQDASRIAIELARTLVELHADEVLHLALDPSHVLIVPGGRARLVGFGHAIPYPRAYRPRAARAEGTLFVAPELSGEISMTIDARADLYALGATLRFMLAGARDEPRDAHLDAIARWLAAPHPHDRPARAEDALEALLGHAAAPEPVEQARLAPATQSKLVLVETTSDDFAAQSAREALRAGTEGAAFHAGERAPRREACGLADPDGTIARLERVERTALTLTLDGIGATDDRLERALLRRLRTPGAPPLVLSLDLRRSDPARVDLLSQSFARNGRIEWREGEAEASVEEALDEGLTRLLGVLLAADAELACETLDAVLGEASRPTLREAIRAGLVLPVLGHDTHRLSSLGRDHARALIDTRTLAHHAAALLPLLEPEETRPHALGRLVLHASERLDAHEARTHATTLLIDAIETSALGEAYTISADFGLALLALLEGEERRHAKVSVRRALAEAARAAVESRAKEKRERLLAALAAMARQPVDIGEVHALRAIAAFREEDEARAIVEARAAARALGAELPVDGREALAVLETSALAPMLLARRARAYTALETTEGRANVLVHDLLHAALCCARRLPPALASRLAATTLRESLARGASPASVLALAHVASTVLDRARPLAHAAAKAAYALSKRFRDPHARTRAMVVRALCTEEEPLHARLERLRHARDEAAREGLETVAVDAVVAALRIRAREGASLPLLEETLIEGIRALGKVDPSLGALLQTLENLRRDDLRVPWAHRGPTFDEGEIVEALEHGDRTTAARAIASQLVLAELFEHGEASSRLRAALSLLGEDERAARDVPAFVLQTTLSALSPETPLLPRTTALLGILGEVALDTRRKGMAKLALAEWLDRLGAESTAISLHESLARESEHVKGTAAFERAVFAERLARAYGKRGDADLSEGALRRAHALYLEAGAKAKASALERQHAWLRAR